MKNLGAYLPQDRRRALATGQTLPDRCQGIVLFADLAGYTNLIATLTEQYGSKIGADKATQTINTLFTQLISQVQAHTGSVIGFGGDALTCWFEFGEADGLAAIHCAFAMQAVVEAFADLISLPGLTGTLSMKISLAAGPGRRLQVGDPAIQQLDILAGRTVDAVAIGEQAANPGDVVINHSLALKLSQFLEVTPTQANPNFYAVTGLTTATRLPAPSPLPESEVELPHLEAWLLKPIGDRIRDNQLELVSEFRPVTVLFVRFTGLDYETDDAAEKLDSYVRWVQQTLATYGGFLIKLATGDKGNHFMAAFGAPLAHDDDVQRAVTAALTLTKLPTSLAFIRQMQIGITQGAALAGTFGSPNRCTYDLLGDTVNLAARLMMLAQPGQILVSQPVAVEAITHTYIDYKGAFALKGYPHRISVFEVIAPRPVAAYQPYEKPLLGREAELRELQQALATVAETQTGQIVSVAGEAGIGKSHLLATFVAQVQAQGQWQVATGICVSIHQHIPYYPWRQIFERLLPLSLTQLAKDNQARLETYVANLNPEWVGLTPLLADVVGFSMPDTEITRNFDPQLRQQARLTLLHNIIEAHIRHKPLLIVLEDVHWLDDASAALLLSLGQIMQSWPLLLLVSHRPLSLEQATHWTELASIAYHTRLALAAISAQALPHFVKQHLGGEVSPLLLSLLQRQAKGNPFYLSELLTAMQQTKRLVYQPFEGRWDLSAQVRHQLQQQHCLIYDNATDVWRLAPDAPLAQADLGLPNTVQGLVLARFDQLPESEKLTLKLASVIGPRFEIKVLGLAHPNQPTEATLRTELAWLQASDTIVPANPETDDLFVFKHHLAQDVIYQTLLIDQQQHLHVQVGQALEQQQPDAVERLAFHFRHSDVGQPNVRGKATHYLDLAAQKAQREFANDTALHYLNQALALEERWQWRKAQIEIYHLLGQREEEERLLQLLADSGVSASVAGLLWGNYYEVIGDYQRAEQSILEAGEQQPLSDHFQAQALAKLGFIAWKQNDYTLSETRYTQAINLLDNKPVDSEIRLDSLIGLGTIARDRGDFAEANRYYEQALTLSQTLGNLVAEARILSNLGSVAYYQNQFSLAQNRHQLALDLRRRIGDRSGEGISLYNLAVSATEQGDYLLAENALQTALSIQKAVNNRREQVNIWMGLGVLYQTLGMLTKAQTTLERGMVVAEQIGDAEGQAYIFSNLGLVSRDQGDLIKAESQLLAGLVIMTGFNSKHQVAVFNSYLSTVSLARGQYRQTIAYAEKALEARQTLGLKARTADDLAVLAIAYLRLHNLRQAQIYIDLALAVLTDYATKGTEFPQRNYYYCFQVLTALGQNDQARQAITLAYEWVQNQAATMVSPTHRQSYLENVAVHRAIIIAYEGCELLNKV